MESLVTIELDRDWVAADLPPRPPRPVPRRLAAVLISLAAVASTAAGAGLDHARGPVRTLPNRVGVGFQLAGGDLYLIQRGVAGQAVVTDYPLPDGPARWRIVLPQGVDGVRQAGAGILLAVTYNPGGAQQLLIALDRGTGRRLWSRFEVDVRDLRPAAGMVLLVRQGPDGSGQLILADLRTGASRWTRDLTSGSAYNVAVGDGPATGQPRVVVWYPDGRTEVLDETTGAVLTAGQLPPPQPPGAQYDPRGPAMYPIGDALLVLSPADGGRSRLAAYDLDTLRPRWQTIWSAGVNYISGCGPVVCLSTDSAGLAALDPATGAMRWRSGDFQYAEAAGGLLAAVSGGRPAAGDRYALLDPRSGRPLVDLDSWQTLQAAGEDSPSTVLGRIDRGGSLTLWLGRVDLAGHRVVPLGRLTDVLGNTCQASSGFVVCGTVSGAIRAWRIESPAVRYRD